MRFPRRFRRTEYVLSDQQGHRRPKAIFRSTTQLRLERLEDRNLLSLFQPASTFSSGNSGTFSATVGDVNSDGKPDVLASHFNTGTVSVQLNNGNSTFGAPTSIAVGIQTEQVILDDFNSDGKLDLAVTNNSGGTGNNGTVAILLGDGAGLFNPATGSPIEKGVGARCIASGDFNGDNDRDIVFGTDDGNVFVLLGHGDGTFTQSYVAGTFSPTSIAVGFFDANSTLDFAVSNNTNPGTVSVFLGNGNGTFMAPSVPITLTGTTNARTIAAASLLGNGRQDLVVTNFNDNQVSILLNDGTGNFVAATPVSVAGAPFGLALADVNGDGKIDLITADNSSNNVSVALGNNTATFAPPVNFPVGSLPFAVVAADLNGDHSLDLATGNFGMATSTISVLTNSLGGSSVDISASEGIPVANAQVATINDADPGVTAGNLQATINWGVGAPTMGTIAATGPNTFAVTGSNPVAYTEEASTVPISVQITDLLNSDTITVFGIATVTDAPLLASGNPVVTSASGTGNAATALNNFEITLGGANNGGNPAAANGFRTINWDAVQLDGTDFNGQTTVISPAKTIGIPVDRFQSRGVTFDTIYGVSGDGFTSVNAGLANQFPFFSTRNIFAMFNDNGIDIAFVSPSSPNTTPVPSAVRGFGAIFLDVEKPNTTSIELFSGTTSLGKFFVPPGASGQAEFLGALFANPVITNLHITVGEGVLFRFNGTTFSAGDADLSNGGTLDQVATDDFVFSEPAPLLPAVNTSEGTPFTGTLVHFTDQPGATNKDFTAIINWGDGHQSAGTIVANANGGFDVNGSNTYNEDGSFTITVDIADFGGSTLRSVVQAVVAEPALTAGALLTVTGQESVPLFAASVGPIATFAHAGGLEPASGFSARVDWGDKTPLDTATVVTTAPNYTVQGNHTYADEGAYTVTVTVNDGSASATFSGTVAILEQPLPDGMRGTPNQRFISEAFIDLLHRQVDPSGLASFTNLLNSGGTRNDVVKALTGSLEYRQQQVNNQYQLLLHRAADPSGLMTFANMLGSGSTIEDVAAVLAGSQEYFQNRGSSNNNAFLDALFMDVLHRAVDDGGRMQFDMELAGGASRQQVAAQIFASGEYKGSVVDGFYTAFLHRVPDGGGLFANVNLLVSGMRDEDLIAVFVGSPEYFAKTAS